MAQRGSEDSPGYRAGGFPHSSQATSCRTFEFSRVSFWYLCHAHSFPGLFEYISALLTLPNRGRFNIGEKKGGSMLKEIVAMP
jgi:hypothetical protein